MQLSIDFGRCFSRAAIFLGSTGRPVLVQDPSQATEHQARAIPSSIYVRAGKGVAVGWEAERLKEIDPDRYRDELKKLLGEGLAPLKVAGEEWYCRDLIAAILKQFKMWAESMPGIAGSLDEIVLTVPVEDAHHTEMVQAATRAGFQSSNVKFIQEPVAAAVYYGSGESFKDLEKILVYDLGGGTCDIAIVQKEPMAQKHPGIVPYTVLGSGGCETGGLKFDDEIKAAFMKQHQNEPAMQFLRDETSAQAKTWLSTLKSFCKNLKHNLSTQSQDEFSIPLPAVDGKAPFLSFSLTRTAFNDMIEPHLRQTISVCKQVLAETKLEWDELDHVVLAGGSSLVPYVKTRLEKEYPRPVELLPDPDLAICKGAALFGANLASVTRPSPTQFSIPLPDIPVRTTAFSPGASALPRLEQAPLPEASPPPPPVEQTDYQDETLPLPHQQAVHTGAIPPPPVAREEYQQEDESSSGPIPLPAIPSFSDTQSDAGSGPFQPISLNEQIRRAQPGATITVRTPPFTYQESLVIDKPITLKGQGSVIIEIADLCLRVNTMGAVNISGITFQRSPSSLRRGFDQGCAVLVQQGYLKLEKCLISSADGIGVLAQGPKAELFLSQCIIQDSAGVGVQVEGGAHTTLNDSLIANNREGGLLLLHKATASVNLSQFYENAESGIKCQSSTIEATQCEVQNGSDWGIYCCNNSVASFTACTAQNNRRGNWFVDESTRIQRSFPQERYQYLKYLLEQRQLDEADLETMRILAEAAGVEFLESNLKTSRVIDTAAKARLISDDVLIYINWLWLDLTNDKDGGLGKRPWVMKEGFSTKAAKPIQGTWLQWRLWQAHIKGS
jgi:hypothetical protein